MDKQLFDIIVVASALSVLVPICIYLIRFKDQPKQNHIISAFLGVSILCDSLIAASQIQKRPSIIFVNLFVIAAFIIIVGFYYEILFKKRAKVYLYIGTVLFTLASVYQVIQHGLAQPLVTLWTLNGAIISVFSVLYICIVPSMVIDRFVDRHLYSNVIINTAFAFYFFTTLFLFLTADFVFTKLTANESRFFWSLHNAANIIKNLGLALGLYYSGKRKTYITLEQLEKMGKGTVEEVKS